VRTNLQYLPAAGSGERDALTTALTAAGDTRLALDEATNLNGYGCQPFPRPAELSLSSSTASTISERAHAVVGAAFRSLTADDGRVQEHVFAQLTARVRDDLAALLDLRDTGVEIVLSPSGTDSQLHALYVSRCILTRPVVSVVVAADETGSGVALAACGRHFDSITPGGFTVAKGKPIDGLATEDMSIPIAVRDQHGQPLATAVVDDRVRHCVAAALAAGNDVVVYIMSHSKTGGHYPSLECVAELAAARGRSVLPVVDACQTRLSRARLRWYIDRGCMVLITGSKFFTGPPLSGALLVPAAIAQRMASVGDVAPGLAQYTTRHDWPQAWAGIRSALPSRMPVGQLLRWVAALDEMHTYFAVPQFVRKLALREFAACVLRSVGQYPGLQLVPAMRDAERDLGDDGEFEVATIFPLIMRRCQRPLSLAQSRILHRALNRNVSALFQREGTQTERDLAARLCHVGQPAAIACEDGATGALRISADARFVHACWSPSDRTIAVERMQQSLKELRLVFGKLALLLDRFEEVERAGTAFG